MKVQIELKLILDEVVQLDEEIKLEDGSCEVLKPLTETALQTLHTMVHKKIRELMK